VSAIRLQVSRNTIIAIVGVVSGDINTDLNPGEQAILNAVSEIHELREWVVVVLGLDNGPHVFSIAGDGLCVGVVRRDSFNSTAKSLRPEDLADMCYSSALSGTVGVEGHVLVHEEMSVGGTAVIMAGEDSLETSDAVGVSGLNATKEGGIPAVLVSCGNNAGIDTSGISVPNINVKIRDGEAGVNVEVLGFDV
jgi:hypothetical protein